MNSVLKGCDPEIILFFIATHHTSSEEMHEIANKMWNIGSTFKTKERHNHVYVMKDNITGYYKIGISKNPSSREKTLQSQCPSIELLFSKKANKSTEAILHKKYSSKRVRGEWFNLSLSDVDDVARYFRDGIIQELP